MLPSFLLRLLAFLHLYQNLVAESESSDVVAIYMYLDRPFSDI